MRISILVKMFILVAVILVGVMSSVLWNTNQVFYEDKKAFVVQLTNKISSGISRLMFDRLQTYQNKLAIFTSNYESLDSAHQKDPNLNSVLFAQYKEFQAIALLQPSGSAWVPKWILKNPGTDSEKWAQGYEANLFQALNYPEMSPGKLVLQRMADASGKSIFTMSMLAQMGESKSLIVAFTGSNLFTDLVTDYKGDLNTVFVVDRQGFSYAHPNSQYVGVSLKEHPVVQEIASSKKTSGAGEGYKDLAGDEVIASYLSVDKSNLYVVTTTPKGKAFEAANQLFRTLVVVGAGVLALGLALALFFSNLMTRPLKRLREIAAEIGKGNFQTAVDVKASDEIGDLADSIRMMEKGLIERDEALDASKQALVQSEKMSAFGQLSAGIAHEVKNPLAGILGHAQLAKGKTENADLMKHLDVIEKETRRTKDIIDNLMRFARAEKAELVPTDIRDAVSRACDLVDHQLSLMGVTISKHLNEVPEIQANGNQLQQVLLNLMMNAGHAMEKSDPKKLDIYLDHVKAENVVRIRIKDTGSGIPPEIQKRIFEPFFTTKPAGKGTGLGLSVSIGIVKDHKGKIYLESAVGKGTTFIIDLPTQFDKNAPGLDEKPAAKVAVAAPSSVPAPAPMPMMSRPQTPVAPSSHASAVPAAPVSGKKELPIITPQISFEAPATKIEATTNSEEKTNFAKTTRFDLKELKQEVPGMPTLTSDGETLSSMKVPTQNTNITKNDSPKNTDGDFAVKVRKPKLKV